MILLIDTSVWIDFLRPRSPLELRRHASFYIRDLKAHLAEPIIFELCRNTPPGEVEPLRQRLQTLPRLATPVDLWQRGSLLGQACRKQGHTVGPLDLLIAVVAAVHGAEVVTFDEDFIKLGELGQFSVKLLRRHG